MIAKTGKKKKEAEEEQLSNKINSNYSI